MDKIKFMLYYNTSNISATSFAELGVLGCVQLSTIYFNMGKLELKLKPCFFRNNENAIFWQHFSYAHDQSTKIFRYNIRNSNFIALVKIFRRNSLEQIRIETVQTDFSVFQLTAFLVTKLMSKIKVTDYWQI